MHSQQHLWIPRCGLPGALGEGEGAGAGGSPCLLPALTFQRRPPPPLPQFPGETVHPPSLTCCPGTGHRSGSPPSPGPELPAWCVRSGPHRRDGDSEAAGQRLSSLETETRNRHEAGRRWGWRGAPRLCAPPALGQGLAARCLGPRPIGSARGQDPAPQAEEKPDSPGAVPRPVPPPRSSPWAGCPRPVARGGAREVRTRGRCALLGLGTFSRWRGGAGTSVDSGARGPGYWGRGSSGWAWSR